ncbi:chemotaxis protein CheX [Acetivibrio mesophilus]|uniref:Chemotaxis protein CheX n=1 Tax=Acetivibrio mesophilus TaxID=2487273 RepID=A0A4V1K2E0_9FIRM|nr:chemotaxis protein CheX [Acetivibrio mesophilus]ODM25041.1 chemotaxis protein CheC [Clostridium sp. Bc-iso-3]RXE59959.1 chemotaxis protein CheX [Acetivibrio mesophilus]HHV29455.1 chemotaxis protein CheX [Clostridium sp.]
MDVKKAFIETTMEVLSEFGLPSMFAEKDERDSLVQAEYVNVVMGVYGALSGNLIVTANRESALAIASAMLGGMEFTEVNDMVRSAMGELLNIIAGNAFSRVDIKSAIYISTPTLVVGEGISVLLQRSSTNKFVFNMDGQLMDVLFSVE